MRRPLSTACSTGDRPPNERQAEDVQAGRTVDIATVVADVAPPVEHRELLPSVVDPVASGEGYGADADATKIEVELDGLDPGRLPVVRGPDLAAAGLAAQKKRSIRRAS